MTAILLYVLSKSLVAIPFVLIILGVRLATKSYSKVYVKILWIALFAELLLPALWRSPLAVEVTDTSGLQQTVMSTTPTQIIPEGIDWRVSAHEGSIHASTSTEEPIQVSTPSAGHLDTEVLFGIWLTGTLLTAMWYLASFLRMKRQLRLATRAESDVWMSEAVTVPFVMPGLKSRIYLPYHLSAREQETILLHERQHIRNGDPWIKCAATCAVILHWFNPFVWLAVILSDKDMEMYCDECAIGSSNLEEKKRYTNTLVAFSFQMGRLAPVIRFSESSVEKRVRHILFRKSMKKRMSVAAVMTVAACIILFLGKGYFSPKQPVAGAMQESMSESKTAAEEERTGISIEITSESEETRCSVETENLITENRPEDGQAQPVSETELIAAQLGTKHSVDEAEASSVQPISEPAKAVPQGSNESVVASATEQLQEPALAKTKYYFDVGQYENWTDEAQRGEVVNKSTGFRITEQEFLQQNGLKEGTYLYVSSVKADGSEVLARLVCPDTGYHYYRCDAQFRVLESYYGQNLHIVEPMTPEESWDANPYTWKTAEDGTMYITELWSGNRYEIKGITVPVLLTHAGDFVCVTDGEKSVLLREGRQIELREGLWFLRTGASGECILHRNDGTWEEIASDQ